MAVRLAVIGTCLLALSLPGCFKSSTSQGSSESSSDSVSSPFRSSSGGNGSSAWLRDLRDYAARFGASEVEPEVFQRDVGSLAEDHGIVDWEADDASYVAIGSGLALSGIPDARFQEVAAELAGPHRRRLGLLYQGYADAHR